VRGASAAIGGDTPAQRVRTRCASVAATWPY